VSYGQLVVLPAFSRSWRELGTVWDAVQAQVAPTCMFGRYLPDSAHAPIAGGVSARNADEQLAKLHETSGPQPSGRGLFE